MKCGGGQNTKLLSLLLIAQSTFLFHSLHGKGTGLWPSVQCVNITYMMSCQTTVHELDIVSGESLPHLPWEALPILLCYHFILYSIWVQGNSGQWHLPGHSATKPIGTLGNRHTSQSVSVPRWVKNEVAVKQNKKHWLKGGGGLFCSKVVSSLETADLHLKMKWALAGQREDYRGHYPLPANLSFQKL